MFGGRVTPERLARAAALTGLAGACLLGAPSLATADETQTLTVELATASVVEGPGAKLTFVVRLSEGPDPATFDYSASGTAIAGADYTLTPKAGETVPAGGSVTIDVPIVDDVLDEDAETVQLDIANVAGAVVAAAAPSGTIEDDDSPPAVSAIVDAEVTEDPVVAPVTVSLTGPSGKPITIDYRVGEGSTATRGLDFDLAGSALVFAPGETSKSISVEILEDTLFEPTETVFVILFGHANVQAGPDLEGKVVIHDDGDLPAAPVVPPAATGEGNPVEGEPATTDLVFLVSLPGPRAQTTFTYRTVAGSAGAADFVEVGGAPVVLPASSAASPEPVPVTIRVKRDTVDELDETFTLELLDPTSGAVVASAVGTIVNDDHNSLLSIGDTSADEPTSGTATMTFTITLSPASERTVGVAWATADGTAVAGVDYAAASGSVSFAPGETTKTVDVTLLGDGVNEENETLKVLLSAPTGVLPEKVVDAEGLGTLVDGNALPSLSISDTTTQEGRGATFVVTLSGTTVRTVTVGFGTADGLAKAGADYVARIGALTFAPGEKVKTLEVTVLDDTLSEPSEDFSMRLGDPVNASITKSSGRALVEASDQAPSAPAPAPTPPPPAAKKKAPAVVKAPRMVLGPRAVKVGATGIARMSVTCQSTSPIVCSGRVELERAAKPLLKLGKRAFAVAKGRKGFAPVKLTPRALAILRRQGSMRVRVIVVYKKSVGTGKAVPGLVTLTSTVKTKPKAKAKATAKATAKPKPKPKETTANVPPRIEIVP